MRSGIITGNSPLQDILGILTGAWNEFDRAGWHIVKTPFFVHCEGVFNAGRHEIPFAPGSTKALSWTAKDRSGSVVIKAGTTGFNIPENAFCEITIFGTVGGNDAH